jgi:NAD(P)-dependent dehydrogenase (short-subunit alcohol dehydrogenase family)
MEMVNPDLDLTGRRAIVTGASRGIGEAIALRLARNGARVALVSRKAEGLNGVAEQLKKLGAASLVITANMNRAEDVVAIVPQVVAAWGGVDILVNNAATNPVFGPIVDLPQEAWDKTMSTNVTGPFLLSREAAREMAKQSSGVIVNIASTGGLEPSPMLGAYSVSKAAIIMLTKVMAVELGGSGIRVNCIAPGLVETRFAEVLVKTPEIHDAYVRRAALGRHGQPHEIATAAHFLASDASAYMTGQVVVIDGGTRM